MSLWATQRKLIYISLAVVFLLIVLVLPSYYILYRPPTCSDGKQDGGEQGVDCGGPCQLLCPALALSPVIYWSRIFNASSGEYNAVAYIENPNLGSYAENVPYEFDLYDANHALIAKRTGTTNIWVNKSFAIFEQNISTGKSQAESVTFQFTAKPVWLKNNLVFPQVAVTNPVLSKQDTTPHLDATIENDSFTPVQNLPVVAILYDSDGNALEASRTVVTYLQKNTPQHIFFTWLTPFSSTTPVAKTEIIPLVNPSGVMGTGSTGTTASQTQ